ncbi:hypothetical protein [Arenicella xantha]|uniref:Outer membrane protein with beta-barrel domain n=1 Tax=Arenicella xantha TaxID=644221 RepID=A0A395JHH2_9GAMM|nr:hypothetical protein [Arenicella xantha]RBP49285.1 hypothetical protein DFR28_104213 [Arenicella xantha]
MNITRMIPILATSFGLVLALSSPVVSAQEYKKITRLGTSQAVCPGGVQTVAELQKFFADNPSVVRKILADSGWSGSADDLIAAVAAGEVSERSYPVGTKLAWMGAKVKGDYVANPLREWAGSQSFPAFQVNVSSGCQVYQVAIPKECCNVSLVSVVADTSTECVAPVAAAPVNEVAPVAEVVPVKEKAKSLFPYFGVFAGTETRARYETAWDMDMKDSSGLIGLRAGLMKPISDKTALLAQLSFVDRNGINPGNVYPKETFFLDVGVERKLSERAFIGGGIGAANIDESDYRDASLFGHVGGDIGKSNLQWFLEGRLFDSDSPNHGSISDNKMFSAGFRYLVK